MTPTDTAVDTQIPVLVIGAGPAGLSTAMQLGRLGTRCLLVERRPAVGTQPRAIGVRIRTMELFRLWGIDERIMLHCIPSRNGGELAWANSLAGEQYGRLSVDAVRDWPAHRGATPMMEAFVCQDAVEPILIDALDGLPDVEVRLSTEVVGLDQTDDGVIATLRDRASGEVTRVRAGHVAACDGAGSPTRAALGIDVAGPDARASFVNIEFTAELADLVGDSPAVLTWIINSRVSGTMIAQDRRFARWLFSVFLRPGLPDPADRDAFVPLIREAVGVPDLPVRVLRAQPWQMDAKVAAAWRLGDVFLVGDAAHRFPPTGGFGLNSSIQDAHNLAWKLHAVHSGWAGAGLLDSYQAERRPIAEFNAAQSWRNMDSMAETGFTPEVHEFAARVEAERDAEEQPLHEQIRRGISKQGPHLNPLGQDIGFGYNTGALVREPGDPEHRPTLDFVPSGAAGRRAPYHVLYRDGAELSTLDLFEDVPVLLAGGDGEGWAAAARAVATRFGVPLRAVRVAADGELQDPSGTWGKVAGIGAAGACLVRPDGHVAWRTTDAAGADTEAVLDGVLNAVLSLGGG